MPTPVAALTRAARRVRDGLRRARGPVHRLTLSPVRADCPPCNWEMGSATRREGRYAGAAWTLSAVATRCTTHRSARIEMRTTDGDRVVLTVRWFTHGPVHEHGDVAARHSAFIGECAKGSMDPPEHMLAAMTRLPGLAETGLSDAHRWLWADAAFEDPALVQHAIDAGMAAESAQWWMEYLNGMVGYRTAAITPAQMLRWWKAAKVEGLAQSQVLAWTNALVDDPADRPVGLSPDDVHVLNGAKVPRTERGPQWAGVAAVCPDLVRYGRRLGASPAEIVALFRWLNPDRDPRDHNGCNHPHRRCGWAIYPTQAAKAVAKALAGLNWGDAAACLHAGMSVDETVAHLRAGADMGPVRLLAALGPE